MKTQKIIYTTIVFTKPLLNNNEFYSSIASSHLLHGIESFNIKNDFLSPPPLPIGEGEKN